MPLKEVMDGIGEELWRHECFRKACPGGFMYQLLRPGVRLPALVWLEAGGSSSPAFGTRGPQHLRIQFDFPAAEEGQGLAARDVLAEILDQFSGYLPNGEYVTYAEWIGAVASQFAFAEREYSVACEFYINFNL